MSTIEKAEVQVRVNSQEAKRELQNLKNQAEELKEKLNEAQKAGADDKVVKKINRNLRRVQNEIRTIEKDTVALKDVMENLDKASPRDLRMTLQAINRELNSGRIERGSKEWKYYQQQIKLVNRELQNIQQETAEAKSWLDKFNDGFNKWGTIAGTAIAAITGVSVVLNKLRSDRDNKEEAQAELKSLTGLDDGSIAWLTKQAEILSTKMEQSGLRVRQSSDEIIKAYMMVGSKKPELLADKEALNAVTIEAMRLAAAAKIDLDDAVKAVTVSLNMYGEKADQAAKYVNVLAAGSQKGAAGVAAQAEAITNAGVAAASAGVSIEQLQGTIQMLAEKGVEGSVAGTALRKFFLVLQTGADETNPKIVGFQNAIENLAQKNMTAADMIKMFGEEAYSAASILLDNTSKVKDYTEAVTGTSVAVEQARINSDTAKARMAQYKNEMMEAGIVLADKLNPAMLSLTGLTKKIIVALPAIIDWFAEYKLVILSAATAIAYYTVATNAAAIKTALLDKWTKIITASQAALNLVMRMNPMTALIAAGAGLVTFLATRFIPKTKEATAAQKELNDEMERGRSEEQKLADIRHKYANIGKMNERQRDELKAEAKALLLTIEDQIFKEETAAKKNYTALSFLVQKKKELEKVIADASGKTKDPGASPTEVSPDATRSKEDSRYLQEVSALRQLYLNKQVTQKEYQRLMEDAELQHLQRKLTILGLEPEERAKIQDQILQAKVKFMEECKAEEDRDFEERRAEAIDRRREEFEEESEAVREMMENEQLSKEEYHEEMRELEKEFYEDLLTNFELSAEMKKKVMDEMEAAEKKRSKEEKKDQSDKEKEAQRLSERYDAIAKHTAESFGTTMGDMIANGQMNLKNFLKETLKLSLEALERIIEIQYVEVLAKDITNKGFAGIALAMAKIAAIKAAFAIAKGMVNNFYTGGYTGDGRWDEPRGIVHAGEFVANRQAVNNPAVRPVLDLINAAQLNNTVGSLSGSDITRVLYTSANVGPQVQNEAVQQVVGSDPNLERLLGMCIRTMNAVKERMDTPLLASVDIEGKHGLKKAQEKYNMLNKNVKR